MDEVNQLFYDKDADVLYLSVGAPRPAISREVGDDVLLRLDPNSGAVVGMTILNLSGRFTSMSEPATLPVSIELHEMP